ncbi:MAG: ATP-binding cassette domain-containing protein [Hyphomicrobiaceae bacterium]|nr:ATP-binding cassette domain-containing protein [Hyphomicrobiaceae bacterium]
MARRRATTETDETANAAQRRSLRPLSALLPYVGRYRGHVFAAFIALLAATGATLAVPLAVRRMIDFGFGAENSADPSLINSYFLMLILVAGALAIASASRFYIVTWLGERIVCDLRTDVFAKLTTLSHGFFDKSQSGELVSRLTADTTQVKAAVGASASVALRNLFLFLGAAALMVWTSPRLSLLVLAAIPFIVVPLIVFGRSVRAKSRLAQDTLAGASAYATEAIGAVRVVQAYTYESSASARFGAAVDKAFAAARSSMLARAVLTAIGIFMVFGSVVVVLWIGATDVLKGTLSAGALSQFVLYSVFAAGALGELSQVWGEVAQASGAAERLSELLREEPAIRAPANPVAMPEPARGALAFEDVGFAYPTAPDRRVLDGFSIAVKPGETVAVVGPSGAGKSTLFHLMLRFYDPLAGRVRMDGVDARDTDPLAWRRRIAIVPQDTVIFAASILDNIRFGRPDASDAEVIEVAKLALVDEFVRDLPEAYGTIVGERGITLSGGQRQRIAIARAILKNAPVLLLDEATSSLDAESETVVQTALERLMQGRTTLVIAHRLATVLKADRILVLDGGKVVEEGTHAELVAQGGLYAKLARLQFELGAAALDG